MSSSWQKNAQAPIKEILGAAGAHVHFAGVLGVSMASLAELMRLRGYRVTGSDRAEGAMRERLTAKGIRISHGNSAELLSGADLLVYSLAVREDSPERVYAAQHGIPACSRAELLGTVMREYHHRIGISGTHGKSTTTAMLHRIFDVGGYNPTTFSGAALRDDTAFYLGDKEYFIYEACEYMDAFHSFSPTLAVITGIELDHTDYFKSDAQLLSSFIKSTYGTILSLISTDTEMSREAAKALGKAAITYGRADADYTYRILSKGGCGTELLIEHREKPFMNITMPIMGEHNAANATAAAVAAHLHGVSCEKIKDALSGFSGIPRRLEYIARIGDTDIYYDYAHHPTEIAATYRALAGRYTSVYTIFKPHTYSRTRDLWRGFTAALSLFDAAFILDIFAAREEPIAGIDGEHLALAIDSASFVTESTALDAALARSPEALVLMGAGNLDNILKETDKRRTQK